MSRRVNMPSADDLFRPTAEQVAPAEQPEPAEPVDAAVKPAAKAARDKRRSSGRVRHDEKMTVYITAEELLDLEHARLGLRRDHGLAVDRGRLVREALAIVLADLDQRGAESDLVRRLTG